MNLVIDTLIVLTTIWAVGILPFAIAGSFTSPVERISTGNRIVGSIGIGILWPFFVAKRIVDN